VEGKEYYCVFLIVMDPVAFVRFLKRKRLVILVVHMRCYIMHFLFVGWVACVSVVLCVSCVCMVQ
jgi:hypothetical protein